MTTRAKGTGLGLAIVQRITEQHQGSLKLADAPKNKTRKSGARIRLVIPMVKPAYKSGERAKKKTIAELQTNPDH